MFNFDKEIDQAVTVYRKEIDFLVTTLTMQALRIKEKNTLNTLTALLRDGKHLFHNGEGDYQTIIGTKARIHFTTNSSITFRDVVEKQVEVERKGAEPSIQRVMHALSALLDIEADFVKSPYDFDISYADINKFINFFVLVRILHDDMYFLMESQVRQHLDDLKEGKIKEAINLRLNGLGESVTALKEIIARIRTPDVQLSISMFDIFVVLAICRVPYSRFANSGQLRLAFSGRHEHREKPTRSSMKLIHCFYWNNGGGEELYSTLIELFDEMKIVLDFDQLEGTTIHSYAKQLLTTIGEEIK